MVRRYQVIHGVVRYVRELMMNYLPTEYYDFFLLLRAVRVRSTRSFNSMAELVFFLLTYACIA